MSCKTTTSNVSCIVPLPSPERFVGLVVVEELGEDRRIISRGKILDLFGEGLIFHIAKMQYIQ